MYSERHTPTEEAVMPQPRIVRLDETEIVKFGPDAYYQPILGDDEGTTPNPHRHPDV